MNKKEPFIKICENCGCEFETKNIHKKCCCASCGQKLRYKNPEDRKAWSEKMKIQNSNSITKEKIRQATIKRWERDGEYERMSRKIKEAKSTEEFQQKKQFIYTEEFKNNVSKRMQEQWADSAYIEKMEKIHKSDEFRNKMRDLQNNPDVKKRASESAKKRWEDEDYRNMMTQNSKDLWTDEYKKAHSARMMERWGDEEYREYMTTLSQNMWNDDVWVDTHFKRCVSYKDYELPSGKVVKLQGYEPQVLDALLLEHDEDDIVIGVKEMNKEIGKIIYTEDGVERRYYPDFYIKSTNTIIEVKSQWTYDRWKKKNELKKEACLLLGFNFEFRIL